MEILPILTFAHAFKVSPDDETLNELVGIFAHRILNKGQIRGKVSTQKENRNSQSNLENSGLVARTKQLSNQILADLISFSKLDSK